MRWGSLIALNAANLGQLSRAEWLGFFILILVKFIGRTGVYHA